MSKSSSLFEFTQKYRDENACIQALVELRWSAGFICEKRSRMAKLDHFILRRAVNKATITYDELVSGARPAGA